MVYLRQEPQKKSGCTQPEKPPLYGTTFSFNYIHTLFSFPEHYTYKMNVSLQMLVVAAVALALTNLSACLALERRDSYADEITVRWSHSSVITDQNMYIVGGKLGPGNKMDDYATPCVSLNLANKFATTGTVPWSFACATNAPMVAGHTAVVNTDIHMVVVYGGDVPDGSDSLEKKPLYLYSSAIRFWSTPRDSNYVHPLVNHTASLDPKTGDMVVFGGVGRGKSAPEALSNSTLRMVTDPSRHVVVPVPPPNIAISSNAVVAASSKSGNAVTSASIDSTTDNIPLPITTTDTSIDGGGGGVVGFPASTERPEFTRTSTAESLAQPTSATRDRHSHNNNHNDGSNSSSRPTSTSEHSSRTEHDHQQTSTTSDHSDDNQGGLLGILGNLLFKRNVHSKDRQGLEVMDWINHTLPSGVSGRVGHTASIVNGNKMVVLGGSDGNSLFGMDTAYVYDTVKRSWVRQSVAGRKPAGRRSHVATVVNDTLVVVHGGANNDFTKALDDVAVLDTEKWTWSLPSVKNAPVARYSHSASQAGPYMILAFGYTPSKPGKTINADDPGLYLLDTSSWQFVTEYDPVRAGLTPFSITSKISPGTIFGLFVASLVAFLVLLIMLYVGCMHYYNKHPRLSDPGENTAMLPTSELRNLGKRLTMKLSRRYKKKEKRQKQISFDNNSRDALLMGEHEKGKVVRVPAPAYNNDQRLQLATVTTTSSSRSSLEQAVSGVKLSRVSRGDLEFTNTSRLSRRTHLDDVVFPVGGLRNRENSTLDGLTGHVDDNASIPNADTQSSRGTTANGDGSRSRPSIAESDTRPKSKHVSALLPRIVGSRLTLPAESAAALARYRFEELEENYERPESHDQTTTIAALVANDGNSKLLAPPPVMPAAHYETALPATGNSPQSQSQQYANRPSTASSTHSTATTTGNANADAAFRDSIDINAVLSQHRQFYVANPDYES